MGGCAATTPDVVAPLPGVNGRAADAAAIGKGTCANAALGAAAAPPRAGDRAAGAVASSESGRDVTALNAAAPLPCVGGAVMFPCNEGEGNNKAPGTATPLPCTSESAALESTNNMGGCDAAVPSVAALSAAVPLLGTESMCICSGFITQPFTTPANAFRHVRTSSAVNAVDTGGVIQRFGSASCSTVRRANGPSNPPTVAGQKRRISKCSIKTTYAAQSSPLSC